MAQKEPFKIMVVDDSSTVVKIIRRILEDKHEIITADSGSDALKKLENVTPDLILLDVEMPDMDGFETIKRIKASERLKEIPVVFLTAKTDIEFEVEAFGLGAVDYINKPFATPLLLKRVELQLSLVAQRQALSDYNNNLQEMVAEKTEIIKELQYAIVYTLSELVEMRDSTTGGHVMRTRRLYELILEYMNKNNIYQDELHNIEPKLLIEASHLHDIGKVAIPDAILLKPGSLTQDEFEIMKTHSTIGYNAITGAMSLTRDKAFLNFAAQVALTHHERWDGSGYPQGLKGRDIPISGRIMALVDVYDALLSKRPYKKALSHDEACKIIISEKGSHFDPLLIDVFEKLGEDFQNIIYKVDAV